MNERFSQTILLCEDKAHFTLVRVYMELCRLNTQPPVLLPRIASCSTPGGNVGWVLSKFADELKACRARHAARSNTRLIVVVDADHFEVVERRSQLKADPPFSDSDPLVLLIPRRNIETWIHLALNPMAEVNETEDYKPHRSLAKSRLRAAAKQIYSWVHAEPKADLSGVPSLADSLASWRRIG